MNTPPSSSTALLAATTTNQNNNRENNCNDQSLLFLRLPFPWALHEMLDSVEQNSLQEFISWSEDGTSFKVHDTHGFVQYVAPLYFKQTKYKSFQRQLHLYGFTRIAKGTYRGYRSHPLFQRHQKHLCMNMKRIKNTRKGKDDEDKNTTKITRTVSTTSLPAEAVVSSSTVSTKPANNKTMTSTKTPSTDSSTISIIIPGGEDDSRDVVCAPASEPSSNKIKCDDDGALTVAPTTTDVDTDAEVLDDDTWLNSYIDNFNMMNSPIPVSSSSSSTSTTCINDMEPRPIKDDSCSSSSSSSVEDVFGSVFPSTTSSAEVQQQQEEDLQTVKVCSVMTRRRSTTKMFDGASNIPYHDASAQQNSNRWNSLDSMLASLVTPRAA